MRPLFTTAGSILLAAVSIGCSPTSSATEANVGVATSAPTSVVVATPERTLATYSAEESATQLLAFNARIAMTLPTLAAEMKSASTSLDYTVARALVEDELRWLSDHPPAPCFSDKHRAYESALGQMTGAIAAFEAGEVQMGEEFVNAAGFMLSEDDRCP